MKILHTADLHLDSPFEGLSAKQSTIRRKEQRQLLQKLVILSKAEEVDLVFLCGDIFDSDSSYFETGQELVNAFVQISAPVFICPGNHDYYTSSSPYAHLQLPENVYVFKQDHMECIDRSNEGYRVFGGAYIDKNDPHLLKNFHADKNDEILNLMCIHGDISEEDVASSGMDYIALGHIHKASGLKKSGQTFFSYPGCPEGRGFDETGEKTVNIVELNSDKCSIKTVSIAKRRYETVKIDVTDKDPLLQMKLLLDDDTANDIYRIIFTGQREDSIDIKKIAEAVESDFFSLQIVDSTTLKKDIWENCGDDTLRGLFLKKMKERYDASLNDEEKSLIEQSVRWGTAALDNMEEVRSHED